MPILSEDGRRTPAGAGTDLRSLQLAPRRGLPHQGAPPAGAGTELR